MIAWLEGRLLSLHGQELVLDVSGVGYELSIPLSALGMLPPLGERCVLHVYHALREGYEQLFGFITREERDLFKNMLKVTGVGPKMALAIVSVFSPAQLVHIVETGDDAMLARVPGIGKKKAERFMVELRDRVLEKTSVSSWGGESSLAPVQAEAALVLSNLGYRSSEIERMLAKNYQSGDSLELLLRKALQQTVES